MSKKLILGLALATVLIGGPFIGAQAGTTSAACWEGFCPDVQSDIDQPKSDMDQPKSDMDQPKRDFDRPDASFRDENRNGPTTRVPFGSPGF